MESLVSNDIQLLLCFAVTLFPLYSHLSAFFVAIVCQCVSHLVTEVEAEKNEYLTSFHTV